MHVSLIDNKKHWSTYNHSVQGYQLLFHYPSNIHCPYLKLEQLTLLSSALCLLFPQEPGDTHQILIFDHAAKTT
jgi:hypothetical protein